MQVYMAGRRRHDGALLRKEVSEGVVQLLKLGWGRLYARAPTPNPHAPGAAHRLEAALSGDFYPVRPPARNLAPAKFRRNRRAEARMQKRSQPLLDDDGVLARAENLPRIGYADYHRAAIRVGERANRPSNLGQVAQPALEFGIRTLARFDSRFYVQGNRI